MTDNGIKNLTNLTNLNLSNNPNITYDGIKHLLPNLNHLTLDCNKNFKNAIDEEIKKSHNLIAKLSNISVYKII